MNRLRRLNFLKSGVLVNGNPYHDELGRFDEKPGSSILKNGVFPDYTMKPKSGYTILYHNTSSENVDSIIKEGLKTGKNLEGYKKSPEEGSAIWTSTESPKSAGYGGNTIAFQVTTEEAEKSKVNSAECMIFHDIDAKDILFVDRLLYDNHKVSELPRFVSEYGKDRVIEVLKRRTDYSEEEIVDLIDSIPKKMIENANPYHVPAGSPSGGQFASKSGGGSIQISSYVSNGPKSAKKALENLDKSSKHADGLTQYFEYALTKTKNKEGLIQTINSFTALIEKTKELGVDVDNIMFSVSNIGMTKEIGGTCSTFEVEPGKSGGSYVQLNEDLNFDSTDEKFHTYDGSKIIEDRDWRVANSTLSTLRHEIGHAAANQIMDLSSTVWEDHNQAQEEIVEVATGKKLPETVGECIQRFGISQYGATSAGEMIAESWCNPNYSKDTRKIYDYMVNELSKIKNQENKLRRFEKVQLCSGCPEKKIKIENANPYHVPAGSPNGGQFASKDGTSNTISASKSSVLVKKYSHIRDNIDNIDFLSNSEYKELLDKFDTSKLSQKEKGVIIGYMETSSFTNSDCLNYLTEDKDESGNYKYSYYSDGIELSDEKVKKYKQLNEDYKEAVKQYTLSNYDEKYAKEALNIRDKINDEFPIINVKSKQRTLYTHQFDDDGNPYLYTDLQKLSNEQLIEKAKKVEQEKTGFSREFLGEISRRELDKVIDEKGISLDKDIVVTRRVANLEDIKKSIEASGKYVQLGQTSATASTNIASKTPGGVSMGDNLITIVIPKGTKFLPVEKVWKDVNGNQDKGILNQHEILLKSGTTFVSTMQGTAPQNGEVDERKFFTFSKNVDGDSRDVLIVAGDKNE